MRGLHHQLELAGLANEPIGLAELNGWGRLASCPEPCRAAADDDQKEEEGEELCEAAHLIIMTSGGGPYKVRPTTAVITFSGSRLRLRLQRARAAAVSSNG